MKYVSSRNALEKVTFMQAVEKGTSDDGGLFFPEKIIEKDWNLLFAQSKFNFHQLGAEVLYPYMEEEFSKSAVLEMLQKAINFEVPIIKWDNDFSVLELFHGPTGAFKDFGARFLAEVLHASNQKKTILVATSGDTGGAVASAFNEVPNVNVVILFPDQGVSEFQRQQLTCWGKNVLSLAVDGTFDDCQKIVKSFLGNNVLKKKYGFTSANSINIARLLPQTLYYAFSSQELFQVHKKKISYVVPTGNMGNTVAAMLAYKMNFPIEKIVMSTNANSAIFDYFKTGKLVPRSSVKTLASAMDVGNPSNFERIKFLFQNFDELKKVISVVSISDDEIKDTLRLVYSQFGKLICPHTATAFAAKNKLTSLNDLQSYWTLVSTAHPVKFLQEINQILYLKENAEWPESLSKILNRTSHCATVDVLEKNILNLVDKHLNR